jgi:hypothetical protein
MRKHNKWLNSKCECIRLLILQMTNNAREQIWAGELAQVSKKIILKHIPCHVMEFFSVLFCHVDIIKWCGKIFSDKLWNICHVTSMVYFEMNNGLLILNMGLAKNSVNRNIVWTFEIILANWRMHFIIPHATNAPNV